MATSNRMVQNYAQLNTIPAVFGILFAVASGVQFLGAEISLGIVDYSFDPAHALVISLFALVVAFASSDTKDWKFYSDYEMAIVGLAVAVMVLAEYTATVGDLIAENEPIAGAAAFGICMLAWGVLAR